MTTEGITVVASEPMHRLIVNLNEILRTIFQVRESRRYAHISLTSEFTENLPDVCVDPHQIEHVLSRLIDNAEESIDESLGRPGRIHVKTAVERGRIQVLVTDNGRGIHAQDMGTIFDDEGKVVGLSICAEMARDNDGDLYAWSSYGNGSAFTLELPIHSSGEGDARLAQTSDRRLSGKRILVIDDEIHITTLLADILETYGAHIESTNSALQAVEQVQRRQYDVLICDQRMPELSGEQLYHSIQSMRPELRHRFLFVTGDALNDETTEFFTRTGSQYVRKPFRSAELVEGIERVLNQNRRLDS